MITENTIVFKHRYLLHVRYSNCNQCLNSQMIICAENEADINPRNKKVSVKFGQSNMNHICVNFAINISCNYSFLVNGQGIYFLSLTLKKKIKFVFLIPKPIVERFLASYILIFVKNYHLGLKNLRTPFEMKESEFDKKWGGICRVLRAVCEFKKIKELVTKNCLEIDLE